MKRPRVWRLAPARQTTAVGVAVQNWRESLDSGKTQGVPTQAQPGIVTAFPAGAVPAVNGPANWQQATRMQKAGLV